MAMENEGPPKSLRFGLVTRRIDERVELLVGHATFIDPERRDRDAMHRTFTVGGEAVGAIIAHEKFPARQQFHCSGRTLPDPGKVQGRGGHGGFAIWAAA